MSYKLLATHNITMMQVEAHGGTAPEEERKQEQAAFVIYPWARSIASVVADLFFCKYYFRRPATGKQGTHTFLGRASNASTAAYIADYAVRSTLKEAARLYGSAIAPAARDFAVGVVRQLAERVAALKKQDADTEDGHTQTGTALMLVNLRESEMVANNAWLDAIGKKLVHKTSVTKSVTNSDAYYAGKAFGKTVSLASQIGGAAARKAIE
jgi:hypothetical protein